MKEIQVIYSQVATQFKAIENSQYEAACQYVDSIGCDVPKNNKALSDVFRDADFTESSSRAYASQLNKLASHCAKLSISLTEYAGWKGLEGKGLSSLYAGLSSDKPKAKVKDIVLVTATNLNKFDDAQMLELAGMLSIEQLNKLILIAAK